MMSAPQKGKFERYPGAELLPGYHLIQILGRGGFGEVWKCEAPGGLHKAVKFVAAGGEQFRQELAAFEQVRAIRHPYLLTLERVELIGGELVMVMELADCQLNDRFKVCLAEGLRGIPRKELLGYLEEAAEALDMMGNRYGLQHLDVKPENVFLVAGHVKVGDYGLVRRKEPKAAVADDNHGFTPRYSAPEVLSGRVDPRSDQYSLALVYCELLAGRFPYSGQTAQQLIGQHLGAPPDLSALPRRDRLAIGRALSKNPAERFPSCTELIAALASARDDEAETETPPPGEPGAEEDGERNSETVPIRGPQPIEELVTSRPAVELRPSAFIHQPPRRLRAEAAPPAEREVHPDPIVSVDRLHGMPEHAARTATMSRSQFIAEVIEAAVARVPLLHAIESLPDGASTCRFLSTLPSALVPFKLTVVAERWGLSVDHLDPSRVAMRWEAPVKVSKPEPRGTPPRPPSGFELVVHRPVPPSAEYTAIGAMFGSPDREAIQKAREDIPAILDAIRGQLQNLEERRQHPRFPANFSIRVYPHYSDGVVGKPIGGECRDVSEGGVRFVTPVPVRTERVYVEFQLPGQASEVAILLHIIRSAQETGGSGTVTVGLFRAPK